MYEDPDDYDDYDDPEFDDEWESKMQRRLDETDADTDLGIEMAKDAQRLVAGELTEAEFFQRYHEAVLEEFGDDDRELSLLDEFDAEDLADLDTEDIESLDDDGDLGSSLSELLDGEASRREVMKKGGAAAALLSVGLGANSKTGTAASESGGDDEGTRYGMAINLNNCDGCLACMTACQQEHGLSRGANWMYVLTYDEEDQNDDNYLVRPCQHCTDSPCTKVCPVGARHTREEDGLVLTDYEICIGCRYCEVSCPYGVNYFQWGDPDVPDEQIDPNHQLDDRGRWVGSRPPKGAMGKCTFCVDRQDGQMGEEKVGTTACEEACAMDAIHFGDLNDPESPPNKHIEQYRAQQENDTSVYPDRKEHTVSTFKLLEERGTSPNIHYLGNAPSEHAEQVEGPVTYEDVDLVDNRKEEVLEDGAAANQEGWS